MSAAQASLFEPPPARTPTKRPRPYQVAAFEGGMVAGVSYKGIRACLAEHRSTAVVLFTGGGKTFIAAQAAQEAPGRVLFLAHLDTLVQQARRELEAMTGDPWEVEQADLRASVHGGCNVVASVQSLMRERRLQRFPADAFSLIIVDEAHHYVGKSFKRPLDHFAAAKILAMTATPKRADKKALGRYVQSVAYKMELLDGINDGWSVPIMALAPIELDVSLDDVHTVGGDFSLSELDEKVKSVVAPVVAAALQRCGDLRTVIFTPAVESAHACAEALNRLRPGCAAAVDGSMTASGETRRVLAAHRRGEFQYLANCGITVEGYDDRALTCMLDAAPTKSYGRFVQKLGRLLRPLVDVDAVTAAIQFSHLRSNEDAVDEYLDACRAARRAAIAADVKHHAVYIPLKFKGRKHIIVNTEDVLGGKYTDAERAKARKTLESKGGDVQVALEEARRRLAARAGKAKVKLKLVEYDPTKSQEQPAKDSAPSFKQRMAMQARGIPLELAPTAQAAQRLLAYEFLAEKRGWLRYRDRAWMQRRCGVSGRGMTYDAARRLAEACKANGWRRLTPDQYQAAMSRPEVGSDG